MPLASFNEENPYITINAMEKYNREHSLHYSAVM
jgi:hypothetical protein